MPNPLTPVFVFLLLATITMMSGCSTQPKDQPWLHTTLNNEFSARMVKNHKAATFGWQDYLAQEEKLFQELQQAVAGFHTTDGFRYASDTPLNPLSQTPNWNRTFVLKPAQVRAGILMLHGLSDSPYSVRHLAQAFEQQGFMVIGLRVPGHGTLPSGLLSTSWKDWAAATQLAAQEIQRELGDNPNFYVLGYSNGGTLALNYTLDALNDKTLPTPQKVILMSPMIGISNAAVFSKMLDFTSHLPMLSSYRWLSIHPEYNPYKYNSFSVNAAWQAYRFSKTLQKKIKRQAKKDGLIHFPPVLTFQSVMDSTVKTQAVEQSFYRYLPKNNSELVLFDINRYHSISPLLKTQATHFVADTFAKQTRNYDLVTITNLNTETLHVGERRQAAGSLTDKEYALDLAFPPSVFSLSHVALPFPTHDALYGLEPSADEFFGIHLGTRHLMGETNTLSIDSSREVRLYSNPFYPYLERRIFEWMVADGRLSDPVRR